MDYRDIVCTINEVGSSVLSDLPSAVMFAAMTINNESDDLSHEQIMEAMCLLRDNLCHALDFQE